MDPSQASDLLPLNLTEYRALGDYEAYEALGQDRWIEVVIRSSTLAIGKALASISGYREISPGTKVAAHTDRKWVLPICESESQGWSAEIGSPSKVFCLLSRVRQGVVTLRIRGIERKTHDEALSVLEKLGSSIVFDLDVKYGLSLGLRRLRLHVPSPRGTPVSTEAPSHPGLEYGKEPLSLYRYARTAQGMPLLEFLAYYQVLEYYFPRYGQREAFDRLRNELRDPRFSANDDQHLSRIIRISNQSNRGFGDERSQLKSVIRYCVSEESLREFIASNPELERHLTEKSSIKGVSALDLRSQKADLINLACDRIYNVRCRVVHSKEDGGGQPDGLLLPLSKEADAVKMENIFMRFLAQKTLIASAVPLHV
ncbi:hypothetical protein J2S46_003961 [Kitasatospora herbaricolor]|uniref:hypothetical protein n=1 Tax=Kitasatospora herbaricolor TaxID=68217 RepID=UPI00174883E6|nr:hypothetical protein [Kitasatospora herbaricolor]MDQ0309405.1 hypothetical protein [Kitasatospora herbaricolor]